MSNEQDEPIGACEKLAQKLVQELAQKEVSVGTKRPCFHVWKTALGKVPAAEFRRRLEMLSRG